MTAKTGWGPRRCLKCNEMFHSRNIGNRICKWCSKDNARVGGQTMSFAELARDASPRMMVCHAKWRHGFSDPLFRTVDTSAGDGAGGLLDEEKNSDFLLDNSKGQDIILHVEAQQLKGISMDAPAVPIRRLERYIQDFSTPEKPDIRVIEQHVDIVTGDGPFLAIVSITTMRPGMKGPISGTSTAAIPGVKTIVEAFAKYQEIAEAERKRIDADLDVQIMRTGLMRPMPRLDGGGKIHRAR